MTSAIDLRGAPSDLAWPRFPDGGSLCAGTAVAGTCVEAYFAPLIAAQEPFACYVSCQGGSDCLMFRGVGVDADGQSISMQWFFDRSPSDWIDTCPLDGGTTNVNPCDCAPIATVLNERCYYLEGVPNCP